MEQHEQQQTTAVEIDGFAWASLIIGSISLFYGDRLLFPTPRNYFLLSLVLPAAGLASAFVANRRVGQNPATRGRQLAIAGALLSALSALVLVLTKIFVT